MFGQSSRRMAGVSGVVLFLVICLAAKYRPGLGFIQLVRFGEAFESVRLPEVHPYSAQVVRQVGAYDGQFYAQLAVSPLLQHPGLEKALDAPVYRAQRIFLPALAWILGAGNPGRIICYTYPLLNVVAWLLFAWILVQKFAPLNGAGLARWIFGVLSLGILESVRSALTDLPALLWLFGYVEFLQKGKLGLASFCFCAATLTKETSLLGASALCSLFFVQGQRSRHWALGLKVCLPAVVVYLAWAWYVRSRFQGNLPVAGNFSPPGQALIATMQDAFGSLLQGKTESRYWGRLLYLFGVALQLGWLVFHPRRDNPWWWIALSYGLLAGVLGPEVWHGYWAAARALLPFSVGILLLIRPTTPVGWLVLVLSNLSVFDACSRFI